MTTIYINGNSYNPKDLDPSFPNTRPVRCSKCKDIFQADIIKGTNTCPNINCQGDLNNIPVNTSDWA
jgi:hypothetical protein